QLRSGTDPERERKEPGERRDRRHHDRTKTPFARAKDGVVARASAVELGLRFFEKKHAVLHDEPDEKNAPHERRRVELRAGHEERDEAADDRDRNRADDQERETKTTKLGREQGQDEHERHASDRQELADRRSLTLDLSAEH